jgi:hypothetical protein
VDHEEVLGLDVPVKEAHVVSRREPPRGRQKQLVPPCDRASLLRDERGERHALEKLHRKAGPAVERVRGKDLDDVRVREPREHAPFAEELAHELGLVREVRVEKLE